jgi:CheY-like chemotaxis protein
MANHAQSEIPRPAAAETTCVFIIDDDREIRETLGELLADEGFVIEAAWNGQTALARLSTGFRPDVIVLDLMMPGMDGMTFRAFQREHPAIADIPVLGLTAAPLPDADFECLRKPLRFDHLVERIRALVGGDDE